MSKWLIEIVLAIIVLLMASGCAMNMKKGTVTGTAQVTLGYDGPADGQIEFTVANNIVDALRELTRAIWGGGGGSTPDTDAKVAMKESEDNPVETAWAEPDGP